jgi:competence protein ComEC
MRSWAPYPLVRVAMVFIAGILTGIYFPGFFIDQLETLLIAGMVLYGMLAVAYRFELSRFNPGLPALVLVAVAGYVHVHRSTLLNRPDHFSGREFSVYEAELITEPEDRATARRAEARVWRVWNDSVWHDVDGLVMLSFPRDSSTLLLHVHDRVVIHGRPYETEPPGNPAAFDYRQYLLYKNIGHQQRVKKEQFLFHASAEEFSWYRLAMQTRERCAAALRRHIPDTASFTVAEALILGVRGEMDPEVMQAYADTGTTHVLAVSGLHVGILYAILVLLLRPLQRVQHAAWIIAVISVIVLWFYAFITGLSPSVLRAVTMFTLLALACPWKQSGNVYNTLAVSAVCLLMYDPFMIMSVGFQLSYLAVWGIVYLQPRVYAWWSPKSRWADWLWQLCSVSIAAQIGTMVLTLYYFHQFPVYFLLANLVAIPVSTLILSGGLLLLAVDLITPLADALGWLVQLLIQIMNGATMLISKLPAATIDGIYLSPFQNLLFASILFMMILFFKYRRFSFFLLTVLLAMGFCLSRWQDFFDQQSQRTLAVYDVRGHAVVDVIVGHTAYVWYDSSLRADDRVVRSLVMPYRMQQRLTQVSDSLFRPFPGGHVAHLGGVTLVVIDKPVTLPAHFPADYLVVGTDLRRVKGIEQMPNLKKVILDSRNSFYLAAGMMKGFSLTRDKIHSVPHAGACLIKL